MSNFCTMTKVGRYGRFGNILWQVAGIVGISLNPKNNCDFKFPLLFNHDHKERFNSDEPINIHEYFENPLPLLTEEDEHNIQHRMFINWGYHQVIVNGNTDLEGHFQSVKYFQHCMDVVRFYLAMKNEYQPCDYTAIHVRCGDYDPDPNAYHPRCSKDYYTKAMARFEPGTKFLVFTDDIPLAKEMFGTSVDYCDANYLQSFKLMKSCRSFICANSSFSLMAAILADQPGKVIVAPQKWFGPNVGLKTDDIYPENSIVI